VQAFTPQSDAGGNRRAGLQNPRLEHKRFFEALLTGKRSQATAVNYGLLLRHQLNIEFANHSAISTPSKSSIIKTSGQYFYREIFLKLFTPIVRGYKFTDRHARFSEYSFYQYTKWLYGFIRQSYSGAQREQLLSFLKEALGTLHDFFLRLTDIPTTSPLPIASVESPSEKPSGASRAKLYDFLQRLFDSPSFKRPETC